MKKKVLKMKPTESIQDAAKKMRESHAAVAVIVDEDKFEGILTERDLVMSDSDTLISGDDGNRCCYFNPVQAELLLQG